jgi:hypothetical protein
MQVQLRGSFSLLPVPAIWRAPQQSDDDRFVHLDSQVALLWRSGACKTVCVSGRQYFRASETL